MVYDFSCHNQKLQKVPNDLLTKLAKCVNSFRPFPKIDESIESVHLISLDSGRTLRVVIDFGDFFCKISNSTNNDIVYYNKDKSFSIELSSTVRYWDYGYAVLRDSDQNMHALNDEKHDHSTQQEATVAILEGNNHAFVGLDQMVNRLLYFAHCWGISSFASYNESKLRWRNLYYKFFASPKKIKVIMLP